MVRRGLVQNLNEFARKRITKDFIREKETPSIRSRPTQHGKLPTTRGRGRLWHNILVSARKDAHKLLSNCSLRRQPETLLLHSSYESLALTNAILRGSTPCRHERRCASPHRSPNAATFGWKEIKTKDTVVRSGATSGPLGNQSSTIDTRKPLPLQPPTISP